MKDYSDTVTTERAAPSTPASGYGTRPYYKTDGRLYVKNDSGVESQVSQLITVSASAPSSPATNELWVDIS